MSNRPRILLTHTPQMRENYYGSRALAGLRELGEVVLHEGLEPLATPALIAVAERCHIIVAEQSVREGQQVLRAVVDDLRRRFRITHTTVQVEVEGCEDNDMYCIAERSRAPGARSRPRRGS